MLEKEAREKRLGLWKARQECEMRGKRFPATVFVLEWCRMMAEAVTADMAKSR